MLRLTGQRRGWSELPPAPAEALGALGLVLARPGYRRLALGVFVLAFAAYALTLPAVYTGGVVGLVSLGYLDAGLLLFALALALLLSLALTLNVFAFRASAGRRGGALTLGAVLSSLVPAGLCCTPVVPSLLAVLGASTPQIFGLTGRLQGLVASYEPVVLALALVLLLISIRLAARNVLGSCALPRGGGPAVD